MKVKDPRYQIRKVKKMIRFFHIFSELPTRENNIKEEVKVQGRMDTNMSHHKEYLFLPGTKVSFMVIVFHVTILDTWIDIANIMDGILKQEMEVST